AQPFNVEGIARDKMFQPFDALGRTDQPACAAPHRVELAGHGIDLAHGVAATGRADFRKLESFRALRPLVLNRSKNLRNDVASTLDNDGVADAHVLPFDLIFIVEGGVLHHDASDGHRLELGDGGERASAADLDVDAAKDGGRLLGREFMRDGEARRARDETETFLQIEAVELIDDSVNVVVEAG